MRTLSLTTLVVVVSIAAQSTRAHEEQQTEEQVRREQLRISVQAICPISGEELGSMGDPIKVAAGATKEEIYLCCEACATGKINPKLWAKIHRNIASAQSNCPVTKKALPRKPKSTVVEGQVIYVGRSASIKEVEANPEKALAQVDDYYVAYLKQNQEKEKQDRPTPQHSQHDHATMEKDDHGHSEKGPHGGTVQTVGTHTIETVIVPKGIMFMLLDEEGKVLAAPKASGSLTLRVDDDTKEYPYELKPLKNSAIGVGVDLSKIIGRTIHMDVTLDGIAAQPVSFHAMGTVTDDTLADAVLISLQRTCPVSGKKLGSMGSPPKIMVDGKPLFVCCAGCGEKVKNSPQQYLAKYYEVKGEQVRPGVFKATLADAQAIAAQKVCPVMDEPLGGMGAPLKVDVKGQAVYICCAGCAKKLHAEPDVYLAKLKKLGVKPPSIE